MANTIVSKLSLKYIKLKGIFIEPGGMRMQNGPVFADGAVMIFSDRRGYWFMRW